MKTIKTKFQNFVFHIMPHIIQQKYLLFLFIHTWWWSKRQKHNSVIDIINWLACYFYLISVVLLCNKHILLCYGTKSLISHNFYQSWASSTRYAMR
jgi:hypothetical protein